MVREVGFCSKEVFLKKLVTIGAITFSRSCCCLDILGCLDPMRGRGVSVTSKVPPSLPRGGGGGGTRLAAPLTILWSLGTGEADGVEAVLAPQGGPLLNPGLSREFSSSSTLASMIFDTFANWSLGAVSTLRAAIEASKFPPREGVSSPCRVPIGTGPSCIKIGLADHTDWLLPPD